MRDGTSNTVMLGERYKYCAPSWGGVTEPGWAINPHFVGHYWDTPSFGYREHGPPADHEPNFTENPYDPANVPAAGIAFQASPSAAACNWRVLQSGHRGSMNIGMGDGAVRSVNPTIAVNVWWSSCHPEDGAAVSLD
jgi:hypothetical protein